MKLRRTCCYFLATVSLGICTVNEGVNAQISSDGSLSTTVSTDDAVNFLIEGGERSLDNLFHSFSEFSIPNLGSAYFDNNPDITNIFSRVTGGNISEIQGLIRANGTANLFLINPAGIMFGENASLDVGGSFFATTAESVVFGDGIEFSATQPQEAPLLTINIAPGLQMGANSGDITVQNQGHALTAGTRFPVNFNDTTAGLQVSSGNTLGLIGKEINLIGGIIRISGGSIQLIGIEEGILNLNNSSQFWQFDTLQVQKFGNINLVEKSLLYTSDIITGDIQLQGDNITFEDASTALIENVGSQSSGQIIVNATDTLKLSGSVRNAPDILTPTGTAAITGVFPSRLITYALENGSGGDILIESSNLFISNGGQINSRSFSNGDTGSVEVNVKQLIEIEAGSPFNPNIPSAITTVIFSEGNAQEINISAQNINILNGGTISFGGLGNGQGGDVNINVQENLTISGFSQENFLPSSVSSTALSVGNSGTTVINTSRLFLLNGGSVGTSTIAEGDAGQLIVNADKSITISGGEPELGIPSRISSDATILSEVSRQSLGLPEEPSGNSGNITLNTPRLIINDAGIVSVSNEGLGDSGSLQINSNQIVINTEGSITAFSNSGKGGNIELNIRDSLLLRNNSKITAEATGVIDDIRLNVNGGNIEINANLVTLLEASQINANAFEGNGGNITITTQGLFVTPNSSITASSQFGVDGTITLNTPDEENKLAIAELSADLTDASQQIVGNCSWTRDNTFYVVGRRGIAKTPQEYIQDYTMWSDIRDLSDNESSVVSHQSSVKPERIIEANAWIINGRGNVELVAVVPNNNQNLGQVASSCSGFIKS